MPKKITRKQARALHPSVWATWTADDDAAVREAIALARSGRRLRAVGDDERSWPALLAASRERHARRMDAIAVALLLMLMAALGCVALLLATPQAKAAPSDVADVGDYVARYGASAVCPVLAEHHSIAGVLGVLLAIRDDGFSDFEAGQIVGMSVWQHCPENSALLERFVAIYGDGEPL